MGGARSGIPERTVSKTEKWSVPAENSAGRERGLHDTHYVVKGFPMLPET